MRFPRLKNTKNVLIRGFHNTLEDDGFELMTTTGPAVPTLPTAAGVLSIVSSSASDTASATKKVVVDYLDATWAEKRAVFLINGTTAVVLDEGAEEISAIRINRVWCNFANIGRIDALIGATKLHEVPIGHQLGATAMYTVPLGQQAQCHGIYISATEKCTVRLRQHLHGEGQALSTIFTFNAIGSLYVPFGYPRRIDAQGVDDAWHQSKITWLADANCLTATVTAVVEIGLDMEVDRTETTSPGFRYS